MNTNPLPPLFDAQRPIRVLVIDDSPLVQRLVQQLLDREPDIQVVGTAPDPLVAREMIRELLPDVLTLDVEMPHMNGLEFLERLMLFRPMPVVMLSSLTAEHSEASVKALSLGAFDCVRKPRIDPARGLADSAEEIVRKVRLAARSRVRRARRFGAEASTPRAIDRGMAGGADWRDRIVVIGASTGGPEALAQVIPVLPADAPPVLIAQHLPAAFTAALARRLDETSRLTVREARDGERALPGHAYVAPGGRDLRVRWHEGGFALTVREPEPAWRLAPSVDALFQSAANCAGDGAVGVLLTGMGNDGAAGLLELRARGAHTIAQDEESCVVWGMPRAAMEIDAARQTCALEQVPAAIMAGLSALRRRTAA